MRNEIMTVADMKEIFSSNAFSGEIFFDEPMSRHTSLRIGGAAEVFLVPMDIISLKAALLIAKDNSLPVTPVGGGSNMLVMDKGIEGAVVSVAMLNRTEIIKDENGEVRLFVEAGTPLGRLVNFASGNGYSGMEGLSGIPGLFGGAIKGNAGSFGYDIAGITDSVALMDSRGAITTMDAAAVGFGYRSTGIPDDSIILSANIRLRKEDAASVAQRTRDFLREKIGKQPVSEHSAGCVFKNPEGASAGRLIDAAGCKGMRTGNIEVSTLHANFFINKGKASASDFLALMEQVRERVFRISGIELKSEIRIIGRG